MTPIIITRLRRFSQYDFDFDSKVMNNLLKYKRDTTRVDGGGCGNVYRGRLLADPNTQVAIKVLKAGRLPTSESLEREMSREVGALLRLGSHSNIVSFLGFYQNIYEPEEVGMAFEYCYHGDLRAYLKQNGKLTQERVRQVMGQICCGLKHIHDGGIIHCDLKPANILVTWSELKIADFGLTHIMNIFALSEHTTQTLEDQLGTPGYADPAALRVLFFTGKHRGSRKWDIWSAGAILYEMICRRQLFTERDEWNRFWRCHSVKSQKVTDEKIAINIPRNISADLMNLLVGCLQTDSNKRLSVAAFYAHRYWKGAFVSDGQDSFDLPHGPQVDACHTQSDKSPNIDNVHHQDAIEYKAGPSANTGYEEDLLQMTRNRVPTGSDLLLDRPTQTQQCHDERREDLIVFAEDGDGGQLAAGQVIQTKPSDDDVLIKLDDDKTDSAESLCFEENSEDVLLAIGGMAGKSICDDCALFSVTRQYHCRLLNSRTSINQE